MPKILFVNGNLHGHVNPTLPLVKELVERGDNVWYFGADSFTQPLQEAGAQCLAKSNEMEEFYKHYRPTDKHPFFTILEYMIRLDEVLIPEILKIWKEMSFDYLIYDNVLGAGQFLGQILSVPVIGSFSSFALSRLPVPDNMVKRGTHPQLDEFYQRLDGLCLHYGLSVPDPLQFFQNSGDLNIVYTSKGFNPGSQFLDDTYRFVSPLIREEDILDFPVELLSEKKVIYISLGTINTQLLDFYQMCMKAFAAFDGIVVLSIGMKCQKSDFDYIPDNFIVRQYVPQLEVLKHASLFLSHAGFNSVKESLLLGVPMLLFPMVNDQFLVAKQAAEKGCAVVLSMKEVTPDLIWEKAEEIMSHVEFETACEALRVDFLKTGGIKEAVDDIEEFWKINKKEI